MGRRASLGKARLRWRGGACPREGKGGGRDEGTPRRGGRQSSPQPGAARNPPPPFTQRGPGTPLPARAAQPAQACGLRSSYCCPGGFLGPGSRGGRPACEGKKDAHYPADPRPEPAAPAAASPGSHPDQATAAYPAVRTRPAAGEALSGQGHGHPLAPLSLRCPSAAARGGERGGGRPAAAAGTSGEPTSFFSHPPPTPPQHTPGRVSLTHWLRCPSSPRLDGITSGGESPTSSGRAGWLWGRALLSERAGQGRFRVGTPASGTGL